MCSFSNIWEINNFNGYSKYAAQLFSDNKKAELHTNVYGDPLLATHPDKFERSTTPESGSVFSGIGRNHVGIVINWDGTTLTIQDENYDGITNTFEDAKADWKTVTYSLDEFRQRMKGVVFANPI